MNLAEGYIEAIRTTSLGTVSLRRERHRVVLLYSTFLSVVSTGVQHVGTCLPVDRIAKDSARVQNMPAGSSGNSMTLPVTIAVLFSKYRTSKGLGRSYL